MQLSRHSRLLHHAQPRAAILVPIVGLPMPFVALNASRNPHLTVANLMNNEMKYSEDYKKESKKSLPLMVLSILNLGSAAMMAALGVLTLVEVNKSGSVSDLSEPFLASYMCMFAVLLGIYEVMWWMPTPKVNRVMRKNFGFLYGLLGKGFYLIFVACLCVGLGSDARIAVLNYATG